VFAHPQTLPRYLGSVGTEQLWWIDPAKSAAAKPEPKTESKTEPAK
jgi:hypothetical protein